MENTQEVIVLKTSSEDKIEFVESYREAVLEVFMLVFERRELDLREEQLYALFKLAFSAQRIRVEAFPDPPNRTHV